MGTLALPLSHLWEVPGDSTLATENVNIKQLSVEGAGVQPGWGGQTQGEYFECDDLHSDH